MPGDDGNNKKRPDFKNVVDNTRIKILEDLVKEKENTFKILSDEKANLKAENLNLKNEVRQRNLEVKEFSREKSQIEEKYKKMKELDKKIISEKDAEIIRLKTQVEEISISENADTEVLKELINTKFQLQETNLHNNINMQELIETKSNLNIKEEKLQRVNSELENLNKIIADHQFEKVAVKNELDLLRSKIKTSFTAEDMSGYLNSTIESFNSQVNTVDSAVNYIINEMDVELKTQVYKDDQSRMMLSSADIASKSDNSLSSIKFSIRAVPKV